MPPIVSVIIPVRDGAKVLPALLESLAAQTLDRALFEVIVVDNASSDATRDVARSYGASVALAPVANRSLARNAGAAAARGDSFAFIDADCLATPTWLEAMMECPSESELVAGPVRITTRTAPNDIERWEALWRFDQGSWVAQGWAATANLRVDGRAFNAIGGFDPAYRHIGEDADFCIRARRAGFALGFCADAVVTHDAEERLWPLLRRSWMHGYSSNQTFHRIETGYRAWRTPSPLLSDDRALALFALDRVELGSDDRRRMARLARLSYAARMIGSGWSEFRRAR